MMVRSFELAVGLTVAAALVVSACGGDTNSGNQNNGNENQNATVCGNGIVELGEACDAGDQNSDVAPDTCRTDCRLPYCGDQVVDTDEVCDLGLLNGRSPASCRQDCTANVCGDGFLGGAEICDDGNQVSLDGCRSDCMQDETACNNGELDPGEECDNGSQNSDILADACRTNCTLARCGDGAMDTFEDCDGADFGQTSCQDYGFADGAGLVCHGNCVIDAVGCSAVCGNGVLEPGEECDDGAANDDATQDACRTNCMSPWCGDDVVDSGENCDDGDNIDDLGCSASCQSYCGDGAYNPQLGEQCDDGLSNNISPSACMHQCVLTTCGDGYQGGGETCDDGAQLPGDGCDANCQPEPGWVCEGGGASCYCEDYHLLPDCQRCVVFVDQAAAGATHDGRSWQTAYLTVQEGIDTAAQAAAARSGTCEVWISGGLYRVFVSDPSDTIQLRSHVAIYGRFNGTETDRNQRNLSSSQTALSGEGGPLGYRVFHVVTAAGTVDATLNGVDITKGQALGSMVNALGGGLYVSQSDLHVEHCNFRTNEAVSGGALYSWESFVTVTDSTFLANDANQGGAVANDWSSTSTIARCTFSGNDATADGGALFGQFANVTLSDSVFTNNSAGQGGGAVHMGTADMTGRRNTYRDNVGRKGGAVSGYNAELDLQDSRFARNEATASGGAISGIYTEADVRRCIFVGNATLSTGAGAVGGGVIHGDTDFELFLEDSLLAGNSTPDRGGAIYLNTGGMYSSYIYSTTFTRNAASTNEGAVYNNGRFYLRNSIIWGNTSGGSEVAFNSANGIHNSLVEGKGYDGSFNGNWSVDAQFVVGDSGTWSTTSWDPQNDRMELEDDSRDWPPGALAGFAIQYGSGAQAWAFIVDNTQTTIYLDGDLRSSTGAGQPYSVLEAHLQANSPAIDSGLGNWASVWTASAVDLDGLPRVDAPPVNTGTGTLDYIDMGCYEYQP